MDKKFYGLILPKKTEKVKAKVKSVFESDDSDDNENINTKKQSVFKSAKTKKAEEKLLEDDPTIYEYDSIYDSMKAGESKKVEEKKKKSPVYINSIMKAAKKRQLEQERRHEKKIHLERLKEGDEFKDKDSFVTSAYRKKMLELQEEEEREHRESQLDEMMDVTKQKDLSGFYRHFLKQTVGEEEVPEFGRGYVTVKKEPAESSKEEESGSKNDKMLKKSEHYFKKSLAPQFLSKKEAPVSHHNPSKYRSRNKESDSSSDDEVRSSDAKAEMCDMHDKHVNLPSTSTCDKDYSDDDDDSSSDSDVESRKCAKKSKHSSPSSSSDDISDTEHRKSKNSSEKALINQKAKDKDSRHTSHNQKGSNKKDKNVKIDMSAKFVKRTVGKIFDAAQARYFKRVAEREKTK